MTDLEVSVAEMRELANTLVPYSFPQVSPQDEESLLCLKQRTIVVDGYEIVAYFSKCEYKDIQMQSLQIYGKYFTFLPMFVVCKVACKFLGDYGLSYFEQMYLRQEGIMDEYSRKIYIWTVYYRDGEPILSPFSSKCESRTYEGLKYSYVESSQIAFF